MVLYDRDDLDRLKKSKPVPITAHSGELVVPVVYADMVEHYLKKKGITLPLSHHELADMKREAASMARGGKVTIKQKKSKGKKVMSQQQTVIVNIAKNKRSKPVAAAAKSTTLADVVAALVARPNTFNQIQPYSTNSQLVNPNPPAIRMEEARREAEKLANQVKEHAKEQMTRLADDELERRLEEHERQRIIQKQQSALDTFKPLVSVEQPIRPATPERIPGIRRPGRPPGSKNKSKSPSPISSLEAFKVDEEKIERSAQPAVSSSSAEPIRLPQSAVEESVKPLRKRPQVYKGPPIDYYAPVEESPLQGRSQVYKGPLPLKP